MTGKQHLDIATLGVIVVDDGAVPTDPPTWPAPTPRKPRTKTRYGRYNSPYRRLPRREGEHTVEVGRLPRTTEDQRRVNSLGVRESGNTRPASSSTRRSQYQLRLHAGCPALGLPRHAPLDQDPIRQRRPVARACGNRHRGRMMSFREALRSLPWATGSGVCFFSS